MDTITQWDGNFLIGLQQALNSEPMTLIMKGFTLLAEYGVLPIAACLLMMAWPKTRRLGIICSLSLAFTFLCCNLIIKPIVDRPRPWVVFEMVKPMMPPFGDASFPSAHTANFMAVAWAVFIASLPGRIRITSPGGSERTERSYEESLPLGWHGSSVSARPVHVTGAVLLVLSFLVGISRLYLGMHYPSDVIAGLILGVLCATAVYTALRKYEEKHNVIGAVKE